MTKNEALESLIVKDADGNRLFDPEQIKDRAANYYEDLYRSKPRRPHPYHAEVEQKIKDNESDLSYDHENYNLIPTKEELRETIMEKRNGKYTWHTK